MKYIIIVLTFLSFWGCKKDEESEVKHYRIDNETKEWIYYKTGSFWVYQDSSSNMLDTLLIVNDSLNKLYHQQISSHDASYYYDLLKIEYDSNNYYALKTESMIGEGVMTRKFKNGSEHAYFDSEHLLLGVIIDLHNSDGDVIGSTVHLNNFDSYSILGNNFSNVKEIKITDYITNKTFYYYLAKNNGMIKIKVDSLGFLKIWQLTNWNIVQ